MVLKFYSSVVKWLKIKFKSADGNLPSWIGFQMNWHIPVLGKPLKSRSIWCIALLPAVRKWPVLHHHHIRKWFGTLNQLFLPTGEQGKGNSGVELACLQMLNISHDKIRIYLFTFFCYLGFLLQPFTNHRTAGEGGRHFFNSSLLLPPASQALRRLGN